MKKIIIATFIVVLILLAGLFVSEAANPALGSSGTLLDPVLEVTPDPGMFNPTFVGETSDLYFTFQNNGTDPIYVTDITFTSSVYSIDYTSFTILPGEIGDLPVHFTPPSVGYFQCIMQIYSNDPVNNPYDIQLNGAGITQLNMGWEWIETGFNYILMDIEFPEGQNQIGYSVGQSLTYSGVGVVIKTIDGGTTWTQLTPDGIPGLEGMSFVDTQTGYAAGWDGYVIKTTDGGATWETLEVVSGMWEISDIEFWDANHGVIAEYYGTYVTADGGETWTTATGMTIMPYKLDYASANVIFAVGGGGVCKSIDGGLTWAESFEGPLLLGVHFLDEKNGLAVGDYGVILQTQDGGANWNLTQPIGDQLLRSAYIWDEDTAWIAGTPELIYKTIDGGLTWNFGYNTNYQKAIYEITFTDNYTGFMCGGSGGIVWRKQGIDGPILDISPNPVSFPDTYVGEISSVNVMFSNNGNEPLNISNITFTDPQFYIDYTSFTIQPGESGELPVYFAPTSKGMKEATMQIFSNDPFNNPYEVQLSGNGIVELNMGWEWIETGFNFILMDIEFPEGQNQVGYCVGQSLTYNGVGIVIKTIDGGSTWTQLTPDGIPGLEEISFIDMQTGYAAGWDGYVIKTTDGGTTWEILDVASGMWEINDIEFYDENHGIIVEGPNIYITADGGATWNSGSTLTKGGHMATYLDQNTIVIVANENDIYKSVDGGYTWSTKNTGGNGQLLLGVDFLDMNYGIAVGDYGYIFTTLDGGESWTSDQQVGDQLLHSTYIWDEDTAWICGTPELVYKTTDGGVDWNFGFNTNWQKAFYRITFTDNYTGFICGGSGGIVLRKEGLPEIPEIAVSANAIDFIPVQVGESSTETFTLSNTGFGNLDITSLTSSNDAFAVNSFASLIGPGDSQEIEVTFTPDEAGLFQGTLTISSNDPDDPMVEIQLLGEGYVLAPTISVNPIEIEFTDTYVGDFTTETITISNTGTAELNVTNISSTNSVFTAFPTSFTVEIGESQVVDVTFTPNDDQQFAGVLQILNNDPQSGTFEVTLSGLGMIASAEITVQTSTLEFDTTLVTETSTAVLTISNTGLGVLNVSGIVSSDPVFTTDITEFDLEPNQSQDVTVSFSPLSQMMYVAVLSIGSNDPDNNPLEISLSGYGDIDTRISDNLSADQVILYPNPVSEILYIEGVQDKTLMVYDVAGLLVKEIRCNENKIMIDAADLKSGVYSLKITGTDGTIMKKIIKR